MVDLHKTWQETLEKHMRASGLIQADAEDRRAWKRTIMKEMKRPTLLSVGKQTLSDDDDDDDDVVVSTKVI